MLSFFEEAVKDLEIGRGFYENQEEGVCFTGTGTLFLQLALKKGLLARAIVHETSPHSRERAKLVARCKFSCHTSAILLAHLGYFDDPFSDRAGRGYPAEG
jgi:hypothetical protein